MEYDGDYKLSKEGDNEFEELIQQNVCVSAKSKGGVKLAPLSGCYKNVKNIALSHRSGGVKCTKDSSLTYFGCNSNPDIGNKMLFFVNSNIIFPTSQTV